MSILTGKALQEFEASRDINAELLEGLECIINNQPSRITVITESDVALARRKAELPQEQFAGILGTSKRTLQSWEQGKRKPSKAAQSLVKLFIINPQFVRKHLA